MNYWERLKAMRLNSMQRRLERYKMIYTWKTLEGLVSNSGVKLYENERKGRLCQIPSHKSKVESIKTIRDNSFQVSGPTLFNLLPRDLRGLTNCGPVEFKTRLDEFLCLIPDQPKCAQMTPVAMKPHASNSLIYQVAWARREGLLNSCGYWDLYGLLF